MRRSRKSVAVLRRGETPGCVIEAHEFRTEAAEALDQPFEEQHPVAPADHERVARMDAVHRALREALPGTDLSLFGAIAFIQRELWARRSDGTDR